jgi:hypothetical protein
MLAAVAFAEQPKVSLRFEPESEKFIEATKEYEAIWASDGARIVQTMEKKSGLKFEESEVQVIVFEGISSSGFRSIPMRMRASYPIDTKKATLIHELGHRLEGRFFKKDEDDHHLLFLYLYDVWVELYGKEFADAQVKIESDRRGHFDYEGTWKQALALSPEERQKKWQDFLKSKQE